MNNASTSIHGERLRAWATAMSAAMLVACGGGGSGSDDTAPPPAPPPPPPAASRCIDPTPASPSTVKFAAPAGAAASSVELSSNGLSACFLGTTQVAARSDVSVALGESSFYYVEATRSQLADVALGISASAETTPPSGGFVPRADTLLVRGEELLSLDAAGVPVISAAGSGAVFGFAVDLRSRYPAVSVIAPASVNPGACAGLVGADAPCVVYRWRSAVPASTVSIYAWGTGDGSNGPRVSINTGSDQLARPYAYATAAVLSALRASRLHGAAGFNPQWPAASGPASLPTLTLTPGGGDRAVVRLDDTQTITLAPTNAAAGTISWKDEGGTERGTGVSLTVDAGLMAALGGAGEHVLTASVVNPQTGRYGETRVRLLVKAIGANDDDDGDGLTYNDETTRVPPLNPGNADTDGDGLSDGAEEALGKDPRVADNAEAPAGVPLRGALIREVGTSPGVIVGDDALSVIFASELNAGCEQQRVAPFDDPIYAGSPYGPTERCQKRAIRANVAVQPGEFRYFESRRLNAPAEPPNVGQGLITRSAQIDPYCCFVDPDAPDFATYVQPGSPALPTAANPTPPSMALNSIGGAASIRLVPTITNYSPSPGFSPVDTLHYGFAVDYTGPDPKVYVVVRDKLGAMAVSDGITVPAFGGVPAVPMLYGHPFSDTEPVAAINLGLQRFHYKLTDVKTALEARGANTATFTPGVGAHRWSAGH